MSDDSERTSGDGRWTGWPREPTGHPTTGHPAPEHPTTGHPAAGNRARRRRTGRRRLVPTWRMVLGGTLVGLLLLFGALIAGYLLVEIPEPKSAAAAQNNVYLYADGSQLARVGEVNRENIPLTEVPARVRHAVLAAEDRGFYDDPAVDIPAMVRAGWNMLRGGERQSGSTITQQYVKNYYLDQRQTLSRKAKELFIAVKLGREVSKDDILEGYLNTSYFGRNAYGIQSAAQAYYGKDTAELTTAEGAYLAALLNAPNAFDVSTNPRNAELAVDRWEYVLDGMVSEGWLSEERRAGMTFPQPREVTPASSLSGERGYLVEAVKQYLAERGIVDEQRLAAGGFRITTTIEPDRQRALAEAVDEQLESALSEDREPDAWVRAGATSVETDTGRVVAMYGGRDYTRQYVNNATRRDYQAASTFKPFVYAAALEHGSRTHDGDRIGPDTEYEGDSGREVVDRDGEGTGWSPENEGDEDYGELTVSEAMDKSVNTVFAQMGADVGPSRVKETAVALGIPEATPGLDSAEGSISLGTATPSTMDLAEAYATLAAHGEHRPVVLVERITHDGEEIELPEPGTDRAVSREAADGTTAILRSVVREGTGTAAQSAGRPAAGKTGTAEQDRAAWFAGYTPELATVVAVFGQDPETGEQRELYGAAGQERVSGGGFPARIWGQYTAAALAGEPTREFDLDVADPEPDVSPGDEPSDAGSRSPEEDGEERTGGGRGGEDERDEEPSGAPESTPSGEPAAPPSGASPGPADQSPGDGFPSGSFPGVPQTLTPLVPLPSPAPGPADPAVPPEEEQPV
ncbi:transglycosylase domain-containing protein [Streptomyces sp. NBC_01803]|uniref:transglycosylase domain-containing protein n=1 Tax=Streptomyces sp. NBC_01803 TaxID=2975946 RepID=UPI002DDC8105|nr:transglycosylase domain-containing protein [Streptomyces sp. NBC_01803]WSA44381.1 transglycosylase domain-containing protein [Streptomyces sp. NBC_01803]